MNRAALVVLPCLLFAAPGLAQTPAPPVSAERLFGVDDEAPREQIVMRLTYSGAEGCPADDVGRATLGAQVRRWDPFALNAPWRLSVTMVHRGGATTARQSCGTCSARTRRCAA